MKRIENSECLIEFGKFIKEGRLKQDMFQSEVATLVGITQPYYSMIENGSKERNVDLVLALKLCQVLKLDINDFIKHYM
jgi:transcriptional regulator with XRE-family HTH domain